jgi:hypothetical protein
MIGSMDRLVSLLAAGAATVLAANALSDDLQPRWHERGYPLFSGPGCCFEVVTICPPPVSPIPVQLIRPHRLAVKPPEPICEAPGDPTTVMPCDEAPVTAG